MRVAVVQRASSFFGFCMLVLIFAASFLPRAWAQTESAVPLRGKVLDSSNAAIVGATVSAVTPDGATAGTTQTGINGEFTLRLAPGSYTLRTSAEGFQESSSPCDVSPSGSGLSDIILQIAPHSEAVQVTESADYQVPYISSATKTLTPLRDVPQSVTVINQDQIRDQAMVSIGDVVRYVPGITYHQGENNRDDVVIRGNRSSADFFVNGVRDDVQYYRDLYDLDRVEALKGPNAMIFGRGGAGGVINRVTKEAVFVPLHEVTLQGGSFGHKRFTADFGQPLGDKVALRLNAVAEDSGSFRDHVDLKRYGFSPALTYTPTTATKITLHYENFRDRRTADRGITSFLGRPADVPIETFYGDPDNSRVRATVNLGSAYVEHQMGRFLLRNRTQVGGYDRFYQNYVPGAAAADRASVALTAYNNATDRLNIFNQSDVTYVGSTGSIRHTILGGVEVGRQITNNLRNSGFFNNSATSILVPFDNPAVRTPITFRPNATDANNHLRARVAATFVQDQIELSRFVQVIAGVRYDRFGLRYHNNRNGDELERVDNLVSPRVGLVVKPLEPLSLYTSYSVSYLPSSGDQFSSLTTITQQVKPEKFNNYEVGAKWDASRYLSFTTAVFRLDRTNTRATDPNDPTRIVQTGSQRTNGFEVGVSGNVTRAWKIAGGYSWQDAFISSATTAAREGAQVGQVPHHTFSLWNHYQVVRRVGLALGIQKRTDMFAAVDNTVVLPGYTRADGAVFVSLTEGMRLQANVENLFNKRYYANADSNTNISPGSPRGARVGLVARF
jgi:catecholate siderophore receptor